MSTEDRTAAVPGERWARWCANFVERHGAVTTSILDGTLRLDATDGSWAVVTAPFGRSVSGPGEAAVVALTAPPDDWGVLLVRKGGFAIARLAGGRQTASKVGRRHVQGRTKAGGQSQQRFARRRENQAREAYAAAADHAHRILVEGSPVGLLVAGGDRTAATTTLSDPRLRSLGTRLQDLFLDVPEPRRDDLDRAVAQASSLVVRVHNA